MIKWCIFKSIWVTGTLFTGQTVWSIFFSCLITFWTSSHLLQLFRRMLPRCFCCEAREIFCGLQNFTWLFISVGDEIVTEFRFLGWIVTSSQGMWAEQCAEWILIQRPERWFRSDTAGSTRPSTGSNRQNTERGRGDSPKQSTVLYKLKRVSIDRLSPATKLLHVSLGHIGQCVPG